ncbi:MAG: hypothetical protein ACKVYV_10505 [Limisphaerales bacterium]
MKYSGRKDGLLCFSVSRSEHEMLRWLFGHFPLQASAARSLSRGGAAALREADAWLSEALADERRAQKSWLLARFGEPPAGEGPVGLQVCPEEAERLLQAANELRVGAWHHLGSPGNLDDPAGVETPERLQWQAIMEIAGIVETVLLAGLHGCRDGPSGKPPA